MDNAIVISAGVLGVLVSQYTTGVVENFTSLGIVGLVVWFFLTKFDKKLDTIEDLTTKIHNKIHNKEE